MGSTPISTTSYPSSDVPKQILDLATVTSNVVVADTSIVTDVNVKNINITHTFDGDLILTLIGPNAARVTLVNRRGSSGDNFVNTALDDASANPVASAAVPFTGTFSPEQPLSALNGIPANGTWKLEVQDAANVDTGSLTSWTLELSVQGPRQCTACSLSLPGEATNLQFPTKTSLTWSPASNASFYNLYRGTEAGLPALITGAVDSCKRMTTGSLLTGPTVAENPLADGIYWYLVRGANGAGEGTAGDATVGPRTQNSSGACP
jgi:subtilisin-like proprotein convertase family protein